MSDQPSPDLPIAWLRRAPSDLALARLALAAESVLYENACFHAQQCAEKALKALLIHYGLSFPRTHVAEALLDLLHAAGIEVPDQLGDVVILSQYAVQTRYPGDWEPITEAEAEEESLLRLWY